MKAILSIAGVIGAVSLAVPALAEPTLAETVRLIDAAAAEDGYTLVSGPFNGSLSQGQTQRFRFLITPEVEFVVVGACDQDCSDLDLRAYTLEGDEVVSDLLTNAMPEINLSSDEAAVADLEVIMANCRVAPCAFTIKVWAK